MKNDNRVNKAGKINIQSESKVTDESEQWKVVSNRRKKSLPIIYGSSSENSTIKAATKYSHYHAFRLQPDLTCDDLEQYLKSKKIDDVKCLKISSKHPDEYSSFKVSVPARLEDLVRDPMTWPQDTCVNRFLERLWKQKIIEK